MHSGIRAIRTHQGLGYYRTFVLFLLMLFFALSCTTIAASETNIAIVPESYFMKSGEYIDISILIDPHTPIAGAQLDILYDKDIFVVEDIDEGDFFKQNGDSTVFITGTNDESKGKITGLFGVSLGRSDIDKMGNFATVKLKVLDNGGQGTITLSNVILSDAVGNKVPVTIKNAYIEVRNDQATSPMTGSGGGGGASGSSGEKVENIKIRESDNRYVHSGTLVTYYFEENENPIHSVSYMPLKNAGVIACTVESLKDTSALVSLDPDGIVYKNINIWIGNAGYAAKDNMDNISITFKVSKSWTHSNNVDPESVYLNHYNEGRWISRDTQITGQTEEHFLFEAKIPGFSSFAIAADIPDKMVLDERADNNVNVVSLKEDRSSSDTKQNENNLDGELPEELAQNSSIFIYLSLLIIFFTRHKIAEK